MATRFLKQDKGQQTPASVVMVKLLSSSSRAPTRVMEKTSEFDDEDVISVRRQDSTDRQWWMAVTHSSNARQTHMTD